MSPFPEARKGGHQIRHWCLRTSGQVDNGALLPSSLVSAAQLKLTCSPNTEIVGDLFEVSRSTVSREVYFLVPRLCNVLAEQNLISLPEWDDVEPGFGGAQFIVDCTSHRRRRVHPGQQLYYRGDKHYHFLTAQVMVDMEGMVVGTAVDHCRCPNRCPNWPWPQQWQGDVQPHDTIPCPGKEPHWLGWQRLSTSSARAAWQQRSCVFFRVWHNRQFCCRPRCCS